MVDGWYRYRLEVLGISWRLERARNSGGWHPPLRCIRADLSWRTRQAPLSSSQATREHPATAKREEAPPGLVPDATPIER
jgi:hypothetical protein